MALHLPQTPANISPSNLLLTNYSHSEQQCSDVPAMCRAWRVLGASSWDGREPGFQCTLTLFGLSCACCILDSQHPLRAGFRDTISSRKSLGSTWPTSLLSPMLSTVLLLASWPFWLRSSILNHPGVFPPTLYHSSLISSWGRGDGSPKCPMHDGNPVHRCKRCSSHSYNRPGVQRKLVNIHGGWSHLT